MSSRERSTIPCPLSSEEHPLICTCEHLPRLVKFINAAGQRKSEFYNALQHLGYDRVTPALIKELMINPAGSAPTSAFTGGEFDYSFQESGAIGVRNRLLWLYLNEYLRLEKEDDIKCSWLLEYCRQKNKDPREHLEFIRSIRPQRRR